MKKEARLALGRQIEDGLCCMNVFAQTLVEDAEQCHLHAVEARLSRVHATLKTTLHGLRIQLKKMESKA